MCETPGSLLLLYTIENDTSRYLKYITMMNVQQIIQFM